MVLCFPTISRTIFKKCTNTLLMFGSFILWIICTITYKCNTAITFMIFLFSREHVTLTNRNNQATNVQFRNLGILWFDWLCTTVPEMPSGISFLSKSDYALHQRSQLFSFIGIINVLYCSPFVLKQEKALILPLHEDISLTHLSMS